MNTAQAFKLACATELAEIYRSRGFEAPIEKLALDAELYELLKEARLLQALGRMLPQSGTQRFMQTAIQEGLGDTAQAALKASAPSARLQQWGQAMRQTPVQRVRAAGMKVLPGEARQLTQTTQQMGGTSLGKRMLGSMAEHAGEHVNHAGPLKRVGAHVGLPAAGALEGLVAQTGRELRGLGTSLRAGAAGRMTGAAGAQRAAGHALGGVGRAAGRGAHALGEVSELAAMVGTGMPALTGVVGGAIPGVSALAAKGGMGGAMAKKYLGAKALGAGDVALRKGIQHLGPMVGL